MSGMRASQRGSVLGGLLALFVFVAGCDGLTGPDSLPLDIVFSPVENEFVPLDEVGPREISVEEEEIVVRGIARLGCSNGDLVAGLNADGPSLTLTLEMEEIPDTCADNMADFRYTARIGPVDPGRYRVRVRQAEPRFFRMTTMADTSVHVGS